MISTTPVAYSSLNARQKEAYNAAKLASVLADYGYTCVRLHDDYEAGDLLALRAGGGRSAPRQRERGRLRRRDLGLPK